MKILFVTPLSIPQEKNKSIFFEKFFKMISYSYTPKGLTFPILAALTPEKHIINVTEGAPTEINYDHHYDLVGISITHTLNAFAAYEIADEFMQRGIKVVIGGYHASALPDEAKQHADSVVIGEAEEIWPNLLKDAENKIFKPFYEQTRPIEASEIPRPKNIYPKNSHLIIQATRGCPTRCEFCTISNMKYRNILRTRPIEDVVDDIKNLPGKSFSFYDNSLTIKPSYSKELFKAIKPLNKRFNALGNINVLSEDDELLKLASEAGCIGWFIGFESVSQKTLDMIGKSTNRVEKFISGVKKIHDHNMMITGTFIFGFDTDTLDVFEETDNFVSKSEIDIPSINLLTPYPGTPLFQRLDKEGRILTKDWRHYNQEEIVFQPKRMTPEEIENNARELWKRWYTKKLSMKRIIRSINQGHKSFIQTTIDHFYFHLYKHRLALVYKKEQ